MDNLNILLVDDNDIGLKVSMTFLKQLHCTVTTAQSAEETLEKLNQHYDLIFLDIGLPDGNGITIAKHIRQQFNPNSKTPIIALSAHTSKQDEKECLAAGMNGYLCKPALLKDFKHILDKMDL